MSTPSEPIRQAVAERREQLGYGVRELAERADIAHPTVSRYLTGKADITTATLQRLFDVLGLEVSTPPGRRKGD